MKSIARRTFVRQTLLAGTAIAATPFSRVLGANTQIRAGIVGINGRGGSHIDAFSKMEGVKVVGLCDIDQNVLGARAKKFADQKEPVQTYTDLREMLDNKEIDVISIATTNHWHSLMTVWACQAGKDVYVEKPASHNVFEGRQCVQAADKYNRIVQHGTQSRADSRKANTIAAIHSGRYGKLLISKGYCCKPRWSIGYKPYEQPPAHIDFNLWLGPAPEQPFHKNLVHYNWHWFWDFGNGDMGNQGVHEMDVARWAIKGGTLPKSVVTMGGRWVDGPSFADQGETPNMELVVFDYGESLLVFETRGLVGKIKEFPQTVTNEFYMDKGVIRNNRFFPGGEGDGEPIADMGIKRGPGNQFENFIHCVRNRKRDELHADILEGHYSSALCHLGNISYRLGWEVPFDTRPDRLGDNPLITESMMTVLENTKAIGVDPSNATFKLGPKLAFDPKSEKFIDSPAANVLLSRPYRKPFVVPEQV